jgi:ankyrin repeat protein
MKTFFDAVRSGDVGTMQVLAEVEPDVVSSRDERGVDAYIAARYARQSKAAEWLLGHGFVCDVFAASVAGNEERLRDLLAHDPSLAASYSADGWTPLHLAAYFGNRGAAEVLIAAGARPNARSRNVMQNAPLHAAAAGKSLEVARLLLANGADVNAMQEGGWTALHAAAQNGDVEMALLLISLGARVKASADNGQTPLDLALTGGRAGMVNLLDEHGASD